MSVAQVFEKLEKNFNADAAQGLDLVFQFDIEDDKTYNLEINDGTCKMNEGAHDDPSVTLIMNSETLQGIVSGETDGMQAFMAGQLRAEGDMMLATKLGELFNMG
ncbi:SCP2 sterol-binding domain-containing protein [Marinobacter sp. G11]|uniref:SCP2 sterol-binding domain-containing protein n=1 Tax=Marinobacter vinifirmus TaxID=355591 RepID=A0A558B8L4_9GAMM|nr:MULTISPECIES: SCP2 sterol-binding domain-containing protein [Marinobacter]MCE0757979.1 SCP2 sterol-binding domain-containing protein [Marinobacter sp. G11]TVT32847.1 MAG: SCP2 sterol-binding domain-containing protein [Marinobacter vinifirmus]|tara:strand:+ start:643 stop:957 length:315 start_codon:yes stop_codon:yes gene_type:complete